VHHFLGLAKKLDMLRIVDASLAMAIRFASSFASFARFLASSLGSNRGLFWPGLGKLSWLDCAWEDWFSSPEWHNKASLQSLASENADFSELVAINASRGMYYTLCFSCHDDVSWSAPYKKPVQYHIRRDALFAWAWWFAWIIL